MQYLTCPMCQTSLHGGLLYEAFDSCPRCGARLNIPPPTLGQRFRAKVARQRTVIQPPDWERITRSQYDDRHYVSRLEVEINGAASDGSSRDHSVAETSPS